MRLPTGQDEVNTITFLVALANPLLRDPGKLISNTRLLTMPVSPPHTPSPHLIRPPRPTQVQWSRVTTNLTVNVVDGRLKAQQEGKVFTRHATRRGRHNLDLLAGLSVWCVLGLHQRRPLLIAKSRILHFNVRPHGMDPPP